MHDDQGTSHSQHDNMQDSDIQDMDCCDHESPETTDGCGSMSYCGACTAGVASVFPYAVNTTFIPGSQQYFITTNAPLSAFTSLPYRPPIA